jgi:hypothetical protein
LTLRLREWIREEVERGIPMDNILTACGECGLLDMIESEDDLEPPAAFE